VNDLFPIITIEEILSIRMKFAKVVYQFRAEALDIFDWKDLLLAE
jgi:hypothetical protein